MRIVTCWVAPFLLFTLLRTSNAFDVFLVSKVSAGSFVDIDACYQALFDADANGDRRITGDEYVSVVQALGPPGFLENVTSYQEMPRSLRQAFNLLACLCTLSGTDGTCCVGDNANISNGGTGPSETPTNDQEVYLFSVCLTTDSTISQTLGTTAPTPMPSSSPSAATLAPVSDRPTTIRPTTNSPTTFAPITVSPTTIRPTTVAPTTIRPTTLAPAAPVTFAPVTPTTLAPVTPTSLAPAAPVPSTVSPVIPTIPTPLTPVPTTPTPTGTDFPVEVVYDVALRGGVEGSYVVDLNQAMNILAPEVAVQNFPAVRVRRRLTVNTRLPTKVTGSIPSPCPAFLNSDDVCLGIIHSITLVIEDQDAETAQGVFAEALNSAILEGRLQAILNEVNSQSTVYIVTGLVSAPTPVPATGGGINTGAGIGIAIGVIAGIVLIGAALYVARKNQADKDDRENTYFPGAPTQTLASPADVEEDIVVAPVGAGTLGASQADYKIKGKGSKSAKAFQTLEEGKGVDKAAASADTGGDSSSNAGSSGWSSSAGVSSLNTGSVDSSEIEGMQGSKLAAIGAASAIAGAAAVGSKKKKKDRENVPPVPDVSREDLDTAIESGDWAAVGATAALLAAASDSQSYSSRSRRTDASAISRGGSSISSLDAARAAELDHLVDAGDWEGVVVAAARFEASEDTSGSGGKTGSSGHSGTSHSESPGKAAKRDEIREEVESLVRRVVPEEIDNVDEMMMQFKGREEELVETLRTMQERQVAQKARVQGQKQAKRDARQLAQQGGMALPVPPTPASSASNVNAATATGIGIGVAAAAGIAAAVGVAAKTEISSDSDSEAESIFAESEKGSLAPILDVASKRSPDSSQDTEEEDEFSSKKRRTALELAIEAGDWEAVGEAAAMMSDGSVNSASTGEINRLADNSTFEGSTVGSDLKYEVNAERAAELDSMIDQGDWTGVVAAASRYNSSDKGSSDKSSNITPTAQDGTLSANSASVTDSQKELRLKEEQEALAQADMWMAIAQQSKSEGSPDAGASDAADWAIARSLSALKSAEAKGELNQSGSSESESGRSV